MLSLNPNRIARLEQGWPNQKVIVDRERHKRWEAKEAGLPVAVLCGGGSGHEPAFAGYVGSGMLSAAVAGDLFASPPTSAVVSALRNTITESGALVIVLCYTGDRLNFGAAVEAIRVETGLDARMVIVSDDVALRVKGAGEVRKTSARGLAGAMLVLKAAGAAAAAGLPLGDVERVATLVSDGDLTSRSWSTTWEARPCWNSRPSSVASDDRPRNCSAARSFGCTLERTSPPLT
jgi:dihydroxyacetone kinase